MLFIDKRVQKIYKPKQQQKSWMDRKIKWTAQLDAVACIFWQKRWHWSPKGTYECKSISQTRIIKASEWCFPLNIVFNSPSKNNRIDAMFSSIKERGFIKKKKKKQNKKKRTEARADRMHLAAPRSKKYPIAAETLLSALRNALYYVLDFRTKMPFIIQVDQPARSLMRRRTARNRRTNFCVCPDK